MLRSEAEFTTLNGELEVVEAYLDIERARFEERLEVTIDVPDTLRNVRIPPLVLQPLVENAVKHGIAQKQAGGSVAIRATLHAAGTPTEALALTVRDTGIGSTREALARGREIGVGLRNVERRLECHYGAHASISIQTTPGQGTVVELRLPVSASAAETRGVVQAAS